MKYNEISHFSHPQHKLKFEFTKVPFKCDGCKEIGMGSSYKCKVCEYDLHMHCSIPTPSLYHPFYPKCCFVFMSRPPGIVPRYCNACERPVSAFLYHCNSCGFDLHPCCAHLPTVLDAGHLNMFLYRKVSGACEGCGKKGRSWGYRSCDKKYNLHVACAKDMIMDSWLDAQNNFNNRTMMTTTSSLCSSGVSRTSRVGGLKGTLFETETYPYIHRYSHIKSSNNNKGKVQKWCGMGFQFVISAILGDPTTLIAALVASIIST